MTIKYGGVIFQRQNFIVYGESVNIFVTPTRLWTIIHKIICWIAKRKIQKILAPAQVEEHPPGVFRIQRFHRLASLNKKLDCNVEGLIVEINYNKKEIFLSIFID